jgi:hypothetical protein
MSGHKPVAELCNVSFSAIIHERSYLQLSLCASLACASNMQQHHTTAKENRAVCSVAASPSSADSKNKSQHPHTVHLQQSSVLFLQSMEQSSGVAAAS